MPDERHLPRPMHPPRAGLSDLIAPTRDLNEAEDEAAIRDDNDDRADRALAGIRAYAAVTFYGDEVLTTILGDFLGDLRHACDALGVDWQRVTDSGSGHYEAEIRGEP